MKKAIVIAALFAGSVMARAEGGSEYQYLYWQVTAGNTSSIVDDYNAAYLYVIDGNAVKTAIDAREVVKGADSGMFATTDLSAYSNPADGYNFFVELALYSEASDPMVAGSSYLFSYADLSKFMTSGTPSSSNIPTQGVWAPTFNVPEPTSGLLMLLGLAGLALRRKRA